MIDAVNLPRATEVDTTPPLCALCSSRQNMEQTQSGDWVCSGDHGNDNCIEV